MNRASTPKKASLLRDAVLASSDGIITTFAVIAGSQGANLSTQVILILGFANLFADGISMAAGNYLGIKSEIDLEHAEKRKSRTQANIYLQAATTFISFVVAGFLPLIPFLFGAPQAFFTSFVSVGTALFAAGCARSYFTKKFWLRSGLESLAIGGAAALVAYGMGYGVQRYVL